MNNEEYKTFVKGGLIAHITALQNFMQNNPVGLAALLNDMVTAEDMGDLYHALCVVVGKFEQQESNNVEK